MNEEQRLIPRIGVEPPPEVSARIRERCTQDLQPARGLSAASRWAVGVAIVAATMVSVVAVYGTSSASAPLERALSGLAVAVALIAAGTFVGLGRGGPARVSVGTRAVMALGPLVLFFGFVWLTSALSLFDVAGGSARQTCLFEGALIAAVPMTALLLLWRRTDPFAPRLTGALIGGWAGLTGAVGLSMACPSTDAVHLLFAHGAAVLGGSAVGAWLGRRLLSP